MVPEIFHQILEEQSILGLFFDPSERAQILARLEFFEVHNGEAIAHEGEPSSYCFIPLSGELELFTRVDGRPVTSGLVAPGRTVNLFSVLRDLPYQYSARFRGSGSYVKIESAILREAFSNIPALETYLHSVTENQDFRAIAKDLESLGCSREFRVEFVSRLKLASHQPQVRLSNPSEVPAHAYFLLEGQMISQRVGEAAIGTPTQIQLPARTWIFWRQLQEQTPSNTLIKTISKSIVLTLSNSDFRELSKHFASDLALYSQSILSGRERSNVEDTADESIDLEELAQSTLKRRPFWSKFPWVQQNDQMDCGPACMAMVSQFYGHQVPIQFWRSQLSTNREGTSLFDLAKTSERCGFTSYALNVENLKELDSTFLPVIALRKAHYIVVYKITSSFVTVGDPGLGIRRLSIQEFHEGFENAVLFLRPNESFFAIPEATRPYSHFLGMLSGLKKEMVLNFVVSLMMVALGLLTPVLSQIFMDDILVNRDLNLFKIALSGMILIAGLNGFLGWARNYYANYLAVKFEFQAHSVFIKKMLSLSYKFFADRHVGDFTRRLSEISKIRQFMLHSFESIVLSVLSLVLYTAALCVYSPKVAAVVFAATPIFFLISWFTGRKLSGVYQEIFKESAELDSNIADTVKGIASVKALGAELSSRWRYEEKFIRFLKAERKFSLTASSMGVFADLYSHLVNAAIMGLAAYMAIQGDLSPGQVVAVTMIAANVLAPITTLASRVGEIQEVLAVCNRLNDVLLVQSEKVSNRGRVTKDALRGDIEFRDVWFRYGGEGSDWVLKGISFKIEAGTNVAFVGPSGSGKSTLAALITRMYEPTQGQIFIDGRDYLDYDVTWLRGQLGILHQESSLFEGTILENISFSEPDVDLERVEAAARKAAAEEFILKKPNDYAYIISPGGQGLSGGEKQRIAMARMFYREPSLLILDEATSALDGIAEHELLTNIKQASRQLTTINIAHRYSTVKFSDHALVLLDGRVMGFGTHEDLRAENEIYQRLFSPQLETSTQSMRKAV